MSMSATAILPVTENVCRLCQVSCGGNHKCVSEENAEMNEVYNITVKYFPAKFLDSCTGVPTALCLECWRHIIEFYSFQESIFEAQKKLLERQHEVDIAIKDVTVMDLDVTSVNRGNGGVRPKLEFTTVTEQKFKNEIPSAENCQNIGNKSVNLSAVFADNDEQIDISFFDLEPIDIQFRSDDENSESNAQKQVEIQNPTRSKSPFSFLQDSPASVVTGEKSIGRARINDDVDQIIVIPCPRLECLICGKSVPNFNLLQSHFRKCHNSGHCYITCCQSILLGRNKIVEHIRTKHAHEKGCRCVYCDIKYPRASVLKMDHNYSCSECPKTLPTGELLEKHYKTHCVCVPCHKVFQTADGLKSHTRMVHIPSKITSTGSTDSFEVLTCQECGETMSAKSLFDKHQRCAHNNDCTYKCNICEKGFRRALHFRDHINCHSKENYYACPHCSQKFQYWSHLESHMISSHEEKCTRKHMRQLLLAEEGHDVVLKNKRNVKKTSYKTNGNIKSVAEV